MITAAELQLCAHLQFLAGQAEAAICPDQRVDDGDPGNGWALIDRWQADSHYPAEVSATRRLIKLTYLGISASAGKTLGVNVLLRRWIEGVDFYTSDLRARLPVVLSADNDE